MAVAVRRVSATPVVVPLKRPLVNAAGTLSEAPLLLIDLETEEGVTGRAYLQGYFSFTLPPLASLVSALGEMIAGDWLVPIEIEAKLRQRLTLMGDRGLAGMALSGIDMAAWDAFAISCGLPMATLLGSRPRPIRAYDSLGMLTPAQAAADAERAASEGFSGMKIKVGRPTLAEDLAAVRAARREMPDEMALMVDFNQCLSVPEAMTRCAALDGEGVAWIEEPVRAADLEGAARIAEATRTPISIGENLMGIHELEQALRLHACDVVMPDPQQIGGVSGWIRAAGLAAAAGVPCSGHMFIEPTAHLLAATRGCDWLEWLDFASSVMKEPVAVVNGHVTAPDRPGFGMEWDPAAVARYRAA